MIIDAIYYLSIKKKCNGWIWNLQKNQNFYKCLIYELYIQNNLILFLIEIKIFYS